MRIPCRVLRLFYARTETSLPTGAARLNVDHGGGGGNLICERNFDMAYVLGYSERETQRLYEQADILEDILHTGTAYPAGARVLEAGCGVGGQTRLLVKRSPDALFTCVDVSEESLATARRLKAQAGYGHVSFQQEDIHLRHLHRSTCKVFQATRRQRIGWRGLMLSRQARDGKEH